MRLRRLAVENWRGIDACDVRFADGVTIVEGPNEAGKSTLVEALLTLVRELDSSKKQGIKAVMPVGRDVGSTVTAEVETGDYHFVYSKTYNRSPQTTLDIRAPRREQLSGREAHERVEAILNETVDLALWEALLTEQGASLHPADLKDSAGLSDALDEAAGSASAGAEDLDLYDAVRAEYERYYTLKAGKPRFADLEAGHEEAITAREAAAAALAEVERDAGEHDRLQADVRRRRQAIPELKASLAQHRESWQAVDTLRGDLRLAEARLAAAAERKRAAEKACAERKNLVAAIATDEKTLAGQKEEQQPLAERAADFRAKADAAGLAVETAREERNAARVRVERARGDAAYLDQRDRLARDEKRLAEHAAVSTQLKEVAETVHGIAIDDRGLDQVRAAERALEVARQKRDLAATDVTVTAERTIEFTMEDEDVRLVTGEFEKRVIASGLEIRFPGIAAVKIAPPRTAAELESELREAGAALAKLLERYGVASLDEAIEQNESRRDARAEMERLKARAAEILGEETAEELGEAVRSLRGRCEAFLERRGDGQLPENAAEARELFAAAEAALTDADAALERAQKAEAGLREQQATADAAFREARETLIGLEARLAEKRQRLESARTEAADEALEARAREAATDLDALEAATADLRARLEQLAPETVEALYTNAKAAVERAERDLAEAERRLAVLDDRLERARADGRFEALEAAERRVEDIGAELDATRRRAAAAERLWSTLNRHRDDARQAYVQPLREAIERLGRIVFGPTFEIAIGDDWTLESRTLDGTTLPFDSLSIGAREQLGILARLAAARIVAKQGGVPLIIDDALGFSDPSRLQTMGAAITAAGKECQIVILTCTPGRFAHVGSAEVVRF